MEKEIRPGREWWAEAICPACGCAYPFRRLPLFCVTGASGTGKTALVLALSGRDDTFIHLESDILWRHEFINPGNDYQEYREMWLRVAKNVSQAGKPVMLYGSVTPDQFTNCLERRYFAGIYMLALVCQPAILEKRLRARPAWREAGTEAFVQEMLNFNAWFLGPGLPDITLLDTSQAALPETTASVLQWAAKYWSLVQDGRLSCE